MGNRLNNRIASFAGLILFVLGCSNNDQDHLARAAGKAREKIKSASGESGRGLTTGWQSVALDARVSARLRWDKILSNEKIQVQATGGVIELKGTVHDLIQRRRAVELAESTVGAEQVVDLLEVPTQEP